MRARVLITAPIAVLVLESCAQCTSDGTPASYDVTGGSATVVIEDLADTLVNDAFSASRTRVGMGTASFTFDLSDTSAQSFGLAAIQCAETSWASLESATTPTLLGAVCTAPLLDISLSNGADLPIDLTPSAGTITVTSQLDAKGNGWMTLQLDIPSIELGGTDSDGLAHTVRVQADALQGTTTYMSTCAGPDCSGGPMAPL